MAFQAVDEPAPRATVELASEGEVELARHWQDRACALIFLRHFG